MGDVSTKPSAKPDMRSGPHPRPGSEPAPPESPTRPGTGSGGHPGPERPPGGTPPPPGPRRGRRGEPGNPLRSGADRGQRSGHADSGPGREGETGDEAAAREEAGGAGDRGGPTPAAARPERDSAERPARPRSETPNSPTAAGEDGTTPPGSDTTATAPSEERARRPGYDCDVLVVGAGIVGLSTAYALTRAAPGTRVTVLEKEPDAARHQTGRNSGVLHSGIYYPPGSLKARYALQGRAEMVEFCAEHDIAHQTPGKLIVAAESEELPRLHALIQRGRQHGLPVRELGPAQLAEHEPHVSGVAAIHVGTTGVCDFGAVARRLALLAEERGEVAVQYGAGVERIDRRTGRGVAVRLSTGEVLRARTLVNCAGLYSDRVAHLAGDDPPARIVPFRGEFFDLAQHRADLVRGLVYPVPDPAFPFLGVHLTRGVHGSVHIGPNAVPALAREGYGWGTVRPAELAAVAGYPGVWRIARRHWRYAAGELRRSLSRRAFAAAVRRLLPQVRHDDLIPAPAGVRAQAVLRDGTLVDDFLITEAAHTVHVLNAPSPAATASLPIGREIAHRALASLREFPAAARPPLGR